MWDFSVDECVEIEHLFAYLLYLGNTLCVLVDSVEYTLEVYIIIIYWRVALICSFSLLTDRYMVQWLVSLRAYTSEQN